MIRGIVENVADFGNSWIEVRIKTPEKTVSVLFDRARYNDMAKQLAALGSNERGDFLEGRDVEWLAGKNIFIVIAPWQKWLFYGFAKEGSS